MEPGAIQPGDRDALCQVANDGVELDPLIGDLGRTHIADARGAGGGPGAVAISMAWR